MFLVLSHLEIFGRNSGKERAAGLPNSSLDLGDDIPRKQEAGPNRAYGLLGIRFNGCHSRRLILIELLQMHESEKMAGSYRSQSLRLVKHLVR